MSLVNSRKMLLDAQKNRYAVAAFNIENMEMAMAVIQTAERLQSPVICAVSERALKYASADIYYGLVHAIAQRASIPVAIHADHAESEDTVVKALRGGFTSVMIDGSKQSYRKNVTLTSKIVEFCNLFDIPVEGELGAIGGKTDSLSDDKLFYTEPGTAEDFVNQTGIFSLAVAIGSAHGIYKKTPRLDIQRLKEIRAAVSVPLVLHGASGLTSEQISSCIDGGICKVNYATELRMAYTDAVAAYLSENSGEYDPKKYGEAAMEAVGKVVEKKIREVKSIERIR